MEKGCVAAQLRILQPARALRDPGYLVIGVPLRYILAYGRSMTWLPSILACLNPVTIVSPKNHNGQFFNGEWENDWNVARRGSIKKELYLNIRRKLGSNAPLAVTRKKQSSQRSS